MTAKPLRKELLLYFFQVRLFNFNAILKTCFKNLFKLIYLS